MERPEWYGYPMVKKFYMFSRFDRIPACDRQTDGRTSCDSIARAMYSIAGTSDTARNVKLEIA